jgi:hypothetical protein
MSSSPDLVRLHAEILRLFRLQISTLEKEVFGVASDSELREYEGRQGRLSELHREEYRRLAVQKKCNERRLM